MKVAPTYNSLLPSQPREVYPLEWLDRLVTISLDPKNIDEKAIKKDAYTSIISDLKDEELNLELRIKSDVFHRTEENSIGVVIQHYHSSLVELLQQTIEYREENRSMTTEVDTLYLLTISSLERLVTFVERRYHKYLGKDERVPPHYLSAVKKELSEKVETFLADRKVPDVCKPAVQMIIKAVQRFVKEDGRNRITFARIWYYRDLIGRLSDITFLEIVEGFCPVDEILISMNYNDKVYIRHLTSNILKRVASSEGNSERLDKLNFFQKAYYQIERKPERILHENNHSLDHSVGNWFKQEITYVEKKMNLPEEAEKPAAAKAVKEKVKLLLNTDIIALLLRAIDDGRIVEADSMKALFAAVVTHLSTARRETLSVNGVRTKAYNPEEREKEAALKLLDKLKRLIESY